ncbi:protein translocase subunit SecF [Cellvibrio sp.]|uniref:protein translocase subunit SecF n=1 Tax=Cellvibrio sp. TaxID=1965322 RepID=UPI00396478A8
MAYELKTINFMGIRKYTSGFSIILTIIAVFSIGFHGFNFGLDFTGGTQLELLLDKPADIPKIRKVLEEEHLKSPVAVVFGESNDIMVRTQDELKIKGRDLIAAELAKLGNGVEIKNIGNAPREVDGYAETIVVANATEAQLTNSNIFNAERFGKVMYNTEKDNSVSVIVANPLNTVYSNYLKTKIEIATDSKIKILSSETVGSQVGEELMNNGGLGIICAFALVFLYVAIQFQWKFSVGAIVSLIHVTLVTLGCFSFFQWDFDLTVLAAIIALIGYSINDTIVIFDRIRENFRKMRKTDPIDIVNISMTQTLGRSIMTHVTVFLVMTVLYFFGGEILVGFSKAMMIGVVFGTYSSIYIAANATVALGIGKEDLMPRAKEGDGTEADMAP